MYQNSVAFFSNREQQKVNCKTLSRRTLVIVYHLNINQQVRAGNIIALAFGSRLPASAVTRTAATPNELLYHNQ